MAETALQVQQPAPLGVLDVINNAVANNATVEVMERLYALYERQEAARAKRAFDDAMAGFQGECPVIVKSKAGAETKSGKTAYYYAPLDKIVTAVRSLLTKYGFSYSFDTVNDEKKATIEVVCIVKHIQGHCEKSTVEFRLGTKTEIMSFTQQDAATVTYNKRYAFLNAFGIMTGDTDTDSNPPPERRPQLNRKPAGSGNLAPEEPQGYQPGRDDLAGPLDIGDLGGPVGWQATRDSTVAQGAALDAKHGIRPASKGPLLTGAWITVNLSSGGRQMVMPPGHKEKLACYSWYAAAEDGTGETIQTYHQNKPREACGDAPESYIGAVDVKLKRSGDYCMIADMRAVQDEPARDADGSLL